ncbi:MAG TPA: ATP-binding protein [Candidatus Saccharimonadales bacterium]|nr:ATP-binding protein [Candidatus Saccharimonadales bacterium]
MSYERVGFNPLDPQEAAFPIFHHTLLGVPVHIVDLPVLLKRSETSEVKLVDSTFPVRCFAKGLEATLKGGKNFDDKNARLFEGAVHLNPGVNSLERFNYHIGQFSPGINLDPQETGYRHARTLKDYSDNEVMVTCDFRENQLTVRNEQMVAEELHYPSFTRRYSRYVRSGAIPLSNRRRLLVAPANETADEPEDQLLFYLSALLRTAQVGAAIGTFEKPKTFCLDDLVITPNGPLYRNPDTFEYVHSLEPEKITVPGNGTTSTNETVGVDTDEEDHTDAEEEIVTFSDLYGIEGIRSELDQVVLFYSNPDIAQKWGITQPPSGIFLDGPAGGGKTSIVRALAHEIGADLRRVKAEDIHNLYLGESEKQVKAIFDSVRNATKPTVLFFDEFEALFPTTDSTSGASSAINAVAAIFKVEIASIAATNPNVIFAAATNYPERVDSTLIRSGRFDLHLTIGLPNDASRRQIFANYLIKAQQSRLDEMPDAFTDNQFQRFSDEFGSESTIATIAAKSAGFSPADIRNVVNKVVMRKATEEAKGLAPTPVSLADMLREITAMGICRNVGPDDTGMYL